MGVTAGLVASGALAVFAACSLTVSPGEYAQGDGSRAPESDAGLREPVPEGGARLIVFSGARQPFRPEDAVNRFREMATAVIAPDGTVGAFSFDRSPPLSMAFSQVFVADGRIVTGSWGNSAISFAPIDPASGALTGDWGLIQPVGAVQAESSSVLVRPSLLVSVGGAFDAGEAGVAWHGNLYSSSIDYAARTGTTLKRLDVSLGERRGQSRLVVNGDFLYSIGGVRENGTIVDFVEVSRLGAGGAPGPFVATTPLPAPLLIPEATVGAKTMFVAGGIGDQFIVTDKFFFAHINDDGSLGAWNAGPPLPVALHFSCVTFHKDKLYVIGGAQNFILGDGGRENVRVDTIYALDIGADGTPAGTWRQVGKLPGPRSDLGAVIF